MLVAKPRRFWDKRLMSAWSFVEGDSNILVVVGKCFVTKMNVSTRPLVLSGYRNLVDDFGGLIVPFLRVQAAGVKTRPNVAIHFIGLNPIFK